MCAGLQLVCEIHMYVMFKIEMQRRMYSSKNPTFRDNQSVPSSRVKKSTVLCIVMGIKYVLLLRALTMNTKIYVCSKSLTSKPFMAKRHTRYCGLVRGPHVNK